MMPAGATPAVEVASSGAATTTRMNTGEGGGTAGTEQMCLWRPEPKLRRAGFLYGAGGPAVLDCAFL